MIPDVRRAYNAAFTEDRYAALVRDLERDASCPSIFRISETPGTDEGEGQVKELHAPAPDPARPGGSPLKRTA